MKTSRRHTGSWAISTSARSPSVKYDDQKRTVSLSIDIDEGKPFYVSRIEFQGNTITRDKVIRRELLLEEGQVYNSQLWEYSLLRLNQLEYFEQLRVDQDSEAHQNPEAGTVDLLLKVKEKGKNSIGLNGGVSGLSGAFLGVNYQTNNFLGLGETLSVQGNLGNVSRQFLFGFSQPYIRNRPINVGFQIFNNKQDFNAAKNYQATTGQSLNLSSAQQSLTQNYNQASTGLNFSVSYPLKRHAFQRLGFTYSLTKSTISAFSTASQTFFQTISFRSGIQGSNALAGIIGSSASFSYIYNTVNNPLRARSGKEYTAVFQIAGLYGNVRYFSPLFGYKSFRSMHYFTPSPNGRNVLGLARAVGLRAGLRRRCCSAAESFLHRRRRRSARIRHSWCNALRLRPQSRYGAVDQPGWNLCSARSNESAAEPVHPGADPGLRHRFDRWRHESHDQRRIPHSDRRTGDLLVLRRLWPGRGDQSRPAEAEPRRLCHVDRTALWLPGL